MRAIWVELNSLIWPRITRFEGGIDGLSVGWRHVTWVSGCELENLFFFKNPNIWLSVDYLHFMTLVEGNKLESKFFFAWLLNWSFSFTTASFSRRTCEKVYSLEFSL